MLTTILIHCIIINPVLLLRKCRPSECHSWASTVGLVSQGLHSGCTWLLAVWLRHFPPSAPVPSPVGEWGCMSAWRAAVRSPEMAHKASANTQWGLHSVSTCWVYICLSSLVLPTEYHKARDLKQHTFIGSPFLRLEVWDHGGVSWDHGVSRVRLIWRSWQRICFRPLPWRLLAPWPAAAQPQSSHRFLLLCIPVFSVPVFPSL